jgi:hypothetical protein
MVDDVNDSCGSGGEDRPSSWVQVELDGIAEAEKEAEQSFERDVLETSVADVVHARLIGADEARREMLVVVADAQHDRGCEGALDGGFDAGAWKVGSTHGTNLNACSARSLTVLLRARSFQCAANGAWSSGSADVSSGIRDGLPVAVCQN